MTKTIINTTKAPGAIGPYSQGIKAAGLVFVSGQLPVDPQTGEFAIGGIEAQTKQSLENIKAVLAEAGTSMDKVIKTTVFLQDMGDFAAMNGVYSEYFTNECPARSCIQVAKIPKGAMLEIEVIALA